ncbi:hypothetical protein [Joostella sp. CR20]|uniref:hypothetical protein n=1 Tax=Joostella sp. CR20 TaxID=2804312 RepID=UPI00313DA0E4
MKKLLLLLFVLGSMSFINNNNEYTQQAYLKKGYAVALSEEYFKEMKNAVSSEDIEYFKKLAKDLKIVVLPKDTKVSVIESSVWGDRVVARIYGKETKVWANYEALKRK